MESTNHHLVDEILGVEHASLPVTRQLCVLEPCNDTQSHGSGPDVTFQETIYKYHAGSIHVINTTAKLDLTDLIN